MVNGISVETFTINGCKVTLRYEEYSKGLLEYWTPVYYNASKRHCLVNEI